MKFIDPHIHCVSRTTDDYIYMARAGVVAVSEPAFWAGFDRSTASSFADYFRHLTDVEPNGGGIHVVPAGHRIVEAEARVPGGRQLYDRWQCIPHLETVEITARAESASLMSSKTCIVPTLPSRHVGLLAQICSHWLATQ